MHSLSFLTAKLLKHFQIKKTENTYKYQPVGGIIVAGRNRRKNTKKVAHIVDF